MRTVILVGLLSIADAIRTIRVNDRIDEIYWIIFLLAALMDILEFMNDMGNKHKTK